MRVSEDGSFLGGPKLAALPPTRRDYDTALRAVGSNQYAIGFLPYNMMDGYQQLVKDFAILRMTMAAQKHAAKFSMTADQRRSFARQQKVRELLDRPRSGLVVAFCWRRQHAYACQYSRARLGQWTKPQGLQYQPQRACQVRVSVLDANIADADVAAKLKPYRACNCTLPQRTQDYLTASLALVVPAYEFDKSGALDKATPESKAFVVDRLAEAASQLRDLVTDAWEESGHATLGYLHPMTVTDLETGIADPRGLN